MTPSKYAENAAAALQQVLRISPSDFNAEGATTVIEQAIRNATNERDTRVHRELKEVQTAAQERLTRLLSASPAVIYSFEGAGKFVPLFVSDNIADIFGYAPAEYLKDPSFWRDQSTPTTWPASRRPSPNSSRMGSTRWSIAFAARMARIAG